MHSGLDQLAGVGLALIAQHVVFRRDDHGRGKPGELFRRGPQRGGGDLAAAARVRGIGIPEPFHGFAGQPRALGEGTVRFRIEVGIRHRVQQ